MIERKFENNLMSQMVSFGKVIETAGQVSDDLSLDLKGQTENVLQKINQLLAEVGANPSHLTRIQIWMKDISYFEEMNQVYEQWLLGHAKPVRACVESKLADERYLIEIQAFAYLD